MRLSYGCMKTQRLSSLRPALDLPALQASLRRTPEATSSGKSWYEMKALSKDEAEVFIYDEVGIWGVTASDFVRDLADIKAKSIHLRINSPGGDVFDGVAIYNAIKRHSAEVTVYIDGLGASIASVIAMAGDKVLMSPHAQMMIHEASGFAMGNAADMRKLADILESISANIASIYAERAGGTAAEWRDRMFAETWYSDQEAVDAGLADAILGKEDAVKNVRDQAPTPAPEPPAPEPAPRTEPTSKPIDWKAVFQEAVELAEEDLFAPV